MDFECLPKAKHDRQIMIDCGMASPAGLEPATSSLEGYCSIQLSYGE